MRTFEGGLVLLALVGAVLLRRGVADGVRWGFLAIAAGVVGSHVALEGAHWQMVPAYLALGLVIWLGLGEGGVPRWAMAVAGVLCLGSVAASSVLPMFTLPKPTGAEAVGTRTFDLTDGGRGRELVVQVWYPAVAGGVRARYVRGLEVGLAKSYQAQIRTNSWQDAAVKGQALPVVLLSHSWGGRRTGYTFLAEELASHGFIVLAMDHPGNSARVLLADGRVVVSKGAGLLGDVDAHTAAEVETEWAQELAVWTADDEYVLRQVAAMNAGTGWLGGKLDLTRVGAVGHSFGGAASLRLLGLAPAAGVPAVRCGVNLDGWTFGGLADRTDQPMMVVYEGESRVRVPKPGTEGLLDAEDNRVVDGSLARGGGYRVFVDGTAHLDFSDQALVSPLRRLTYTGPIGGVRARELTRGLVLGFLEQALMGMGNGPVGGPEVHVERFAGR